MSLLKDWRNSSRISFGVLDGDNAQNNNPATNYYSIEGINKEKSFWLSLTKGSMLYSLNPPSSPPINRTESQLPNILDADVESYFDGTNNYTLPSAALVDDAYIKLSDNYRIKWSKKYENLKFLKITELDLSSITMSMRSDIIVDFFTVDDNTPFSEPLRVIANKNRCDFFIRGKQVETPILPLPLNREKAKLVAIVYAHQQGLSKPGELLAPLFVSYHLLSYSTLSTVELTFDGYRSNFNQAQSFEASRKPMQVTIKAEESPLDIEYTSRLAPFSPLYPTPLLCIYGIVLKIASKTKQKNQMIHIIFSLSCASYDEPMNVGLDYLTGEYKNQVSSSIVMLSLQNNSQTLYLPDLICFDLSKLPTPYYEQPILNIIILSTQSSEKLFITSLALDKDTTRFKVPLHKSSFISKVFQKGDDISFDLYYPTGVAPTTPIYNMLTGKAKISKEPLLNNFGPYLLNTLLSQESISLPQITDLLGNVDQNTINEYIDSYLVINPSTISNFLKLFNSYLRTSINPTQSDQLFRLYFKVILIKTLEDDIYPIIEELICSEASKHHSQSIARFLLLMNQITKPAPIQDLAFKYARNLEPQQQITFFSILFSDYYFVSTLLTNTKYQEQRPMSQYTPLTSLLFQLVNECFITDRDTGKALEMTSILATTLELHFPRELSKKYAAMLFPLLTIIYTYSDLHSEKDYAPIILFLINNAPKYQFKNYMLLLSEDKRLLFFSFLASIAKSYPSEEIEVKRRVIHSLRFLMTKNVISIDCLVSIFNMLLEMITPSLGAPMFLSLFSLLSSLIKVYEEMICQQTGLLMTLCARIVPQTQSKSQRIKTMSVSFLKWLSKIDPKHMALAIEYSVMEVAFSGQLSNDFLPQLGIGLDSFYKKVSDVISKDLHPYQQIGRLIKLLDEYSSFPAAQALLLEEIAKKCESCNDLPSAMIGYWQLAAIISDSNHFKGISEERWYLPDRLRLKPVIEQDKVFLLQSKHFTYQFLSECLLKTLELLDKAQLYFFTEIYSQQPTTFLEKQREFKQLGKLYIKLSDSFQRLIDTKVKIPLMFALIKLRGTTVIGCYTDKDFLKRMKEYASALGQIDFASQQVRPQKDELEKCSCKKFSYTELKKAKTWEDHYARKIIYLTVNRLPWIKPFETAMETEVIEYTKREFFVLKLDAFVGKLRGFVNQIKSLTPHSKLIDSWKMKLSRVVPTSELLELARKVTADVENDREGVKEYYRLVYEVNKEGKTEGVPEEIREKALVIWEDVKNAVAVVVELRNLVGRTFETQEGMKEKELLKRVGGVLKETEKHVEPDLDGWCYISQ